MNRVLMFVPQYPYPVVGGLEKQAHELSRALISKGMEIQVVSGKTARAQSRREVVDGVPVTRITWSKNRVFRFMFEPLIIAMVLLRLRGTYDIIHLHQYSWISLYVIMIAKALRKPVMTKMCSVGEMGLPGLRNHRFGRIKQKILLQSDVIVSMSGKSLSELDDAGYLRSRVLLTPNGIALRPRPASVEPERRKKEDRCKVVFVGRMCEEKKLDVLLDVWAELCAESDRQAILELWGNGPLENHLKVRCRRLGISSSVIFCGYIDNVQDRLPDMDLFVLPSMLEGNSNAILEAMAAGLPVVSTLVGGTPMLVGSDGRPFLYMPDDHSALKMKLLQLIRDSGLRESVGSSMRRRVERYFDINRVAQTYVDAYGLMNAGLAERIETIANPVVTAGEE